MASATRQTWLAALVWLTGSLLGGCAAQQTQSSAEVRDRINRLLLGSWSGTLEYRDYSSDARVVLPAELTVVRVGDTLQMNYTYHDGPGKTVTSTQQVTIDPAAGLLVEESTEGERHEYKASGLRELARDGEGAVILTRPGMENDKPVEMRTEFVLSGPRWTMTKQTRSAGGTFAFRNRYSFTRKH